MVDLAWLVVPCYRAVKTALIEEDISDDALMQLARMLYDDDCFLLKPELYGHPSLGQCSGSVVLCTDR